MAKTIFRLAVIFLVLSAGLTSLAAADLETRIVGVTGKVEIMAPGGAWASAKADQVVDLGATISTGFKSEAIVQIGSAKVTLKALSRLTVKELAEQAGLISADVYLQVGRVKADVQKVPEKALNYKFRSPVATASVRGTELEFDGVTLTVIEGRVDYVAPNGATVPVAAGQEASFNTNAPSTGMAEPEDTLVAESEVSSDPGASYTPSTVEAPPVLTPERPQTISVTITVQ